MAITKVVVDCSTGEQTEIELTGEELAQYEAMQADVEARMRAEEEAIAKEQADKESALQKLTALGLTEAEALALMGGQ